MILIVWKHTILAFSDWRVNSKKALEYLKNVVKRQRRMKIKLSEYLFTCYALYRSGG